MILFFGDPKNQVFAVQCKLELPHSEIEKLSWLFSGAPFLSKYSVQGEFYGPRATMVTPWSTNAVEITQNMGLNGIERIEVYEEKNQMSHPDPMLVALVSGLTQDLFKVAILPESIIEIHDIAAYNTQEGLALNQEEVSYLEALSKSLKLLTTFIPIPPPPALAFTRIGYPMLSH